MAVPNHPRSDAGSSLTTFKDAVAADSYALMRDMFGESRAKEAAQHVAVAFRTLARINPKVAECTRASVAQCLAMCALTRLMPGGAMPGVYLIPRSRRVKVVVTDAQGRDREGWQSVQELNFQIGFRGLLQLAQRAGYVLAAYPVYGGAPVHLDALGHLIIPDEPQRPDRSWENFIGVVVTIHSTDGKSLGRHFVGVDLIEERRNVSDSWIKGTSLTRMDGWGKNAKEVKKTDEEIERDQSSPWFVWAEPMALKTALTYVIRRGYVPLDDVADEVLAADAKSDAVDVTAQVMQVVPVVAQVSGPTSARQRALGVGAPAGTSPLPEPTRQAERERVPVTRVEEPTPEEMEAIRREERGESDDDEGMS